MDAEAIKEIANQLGLATVKVQDMVGSLVPQYVRYRIFDYLGRYLFIAVFLIILAAVVLFFFKFDLVCEDEPESVTLYKRLRVGVRVVIAVGVIGSFIFSVAQVLSAPELSFLLFVTK